MALKYDPNQPPAQITGGFVWKLSYHTQRETADVSNDADLQDQLREIEKMLHSLEHILTGKALDAARKPLLERKEALLAGSGAIAQGENITVLGQGAVRMDGKVNGDIVTGVKISLGETGADPAGLRAAYLSRLLETASQLSLSGIDPKAASEAQSHIDLSAVYTALQTLTLEYPTEFPIRDELISDDLERIMDRLLDEIRRRSALEMLDRFPRLVLLGDPGSGKSTFVNFVAVCLAGAALGRSDANLELLIAPLPPDEDDGRRKRDEPPRPQPWQHGALLPVRVLLRDFAARGLPAPGEKATARHLWDFIVSELAAASLADLEKHLKQELLEKGGLLLLDGLDEVPEVEQRRTQIKQAIEDFAATFHRCRILVTSRTYVYQKQDWRLQGFIEAVLAPFTRGQVRQFIYRWYAYIAALRGLNADDAQGRAELLERAILGSDRLLGLAERPLLLTLMASLHAWRGGSLPEKREELYADAVDLLLDWWERPKVVRDAQGRPLVQQQSLSEWLKVDRQKVRHLLNALAFRAHASQPDPVGTADIGEGDLVGGLMHLSNNPDVNPAMLVDYLSQRAGLLFPRGMGVYTFPHRTFQEYLAACYLTDHDYPDQVAELASQDFNRWREAALLAGAKAGRGTPSALWSLVDALCFDEIQPGCEAGRLWGVHLAGQALAESIDIGVVGDRNRPKLERVQRGLVQVLQTGRLPAIERARAGDTLAKLGDPRREVTSIEGMAFCLVPGGPFVMGSNVNDNEKPRHTVEHLAYPYWIGRYPVTVAQWRAYVAASQIEPGEPDSLRDPDNCPVRWVSWHEALAFCKWLSEQYRALLPDGYAFGLPSEAEWEKAARGGLQAPKRPVVQAMGSGLRLPENMTLAANPAPEREYPWQGQDNPGFANTEETRIGTPSSVGCFMGWASPYGLLELSGNVWEWTRSLWGTDWAKPEFRYPYKPDDGREQPRANDKNLYVRRGGSFHNAARDSRCSSRHRNNPNRSYGDNGFRLVISPLGDSAD